jgi:signal transduction histidine kinase
METFVDLTEVKTLRDKLEDEKKKLSLAVQNSGLIFCEYDFKTNEIIIDNSFEFLTEGNSKSVAENVIGNIYSNDVKSVTDKFEAIRLGLKDTLVAEFRVKHPTRGLIWLSASVLITKRDENNQPRNLIGLLQDITERIAIQQELIKAKEKAEESDRMKSSYLGNMSHKIRTPLNAIVGFANLISEEELEQEERNNFINIIRRDTEQVLHLIDDIINIAKIESNQMGVSEKTVSINQMINNMADYYKVHEKADKIKLNVKTMLPDGKDIISTDAEKLQQAFGNLVNNAFKFTNEGAIELGYYINPVDKKLIIYVKDTGIGIPDDSKDKIFTHYYQVNQMSEGTGLGLTISKSMINLLGGKIHFDSKLNEGSTFYIELPFSEV